MMATMPSGSLQHKPQKRVAQARRRGRKGSFSGAACTSQPAQRDCLSALGVRLAGPLGRRHRAGHWESQDRSDRVWPCGLPDRHRGGDQARSPRPPGSVGAWEGAAGSGVTGSSQRGLESRRDPDTELSAVPSAPGDLDVAPAPALAHLNPQSQAPHRASPNKPQPCADDLAARPPSQAHCS